MLGLQASTKIVDGAATTTASFNVLQILVLALVAGIAAIKVGRPARASWRSTPRPWRWCARCCGG